MHESYPIVRFAVHLAASLGVSKVIKDVIRNNTNVETTADALKTWTGSLVLGSLVAEHASNHVQKRWETAIGWWNSRKAAEPEVK